MQTQRKYPSDNIFPFSMNILQVFTCCCEFNAEFCGQIVLCTRLDDFANGEFSTTEYSSIFKKNSDRLIRYAYKIYFQVLIIMNSALNMLIMTNCSHEMHINEKA